MPLTWYGSFSRLFQIRSVFSSNAISCWPPRWMRLSLRTRASSGGVASGSILSGQLPSSPHSTALSVPWPRPVSASDPYSSTVTRATRAMSPVSTSQRSTKRAAARIGPIVCEDDGPMPILKMSKTLTAMLHAARGKLGYSTPCPTTPLCLAPAPLPTRRLQTVRRSHRAAGARTGAGFRERLDRRPCGTGGALRRARAGAARRSIRPRTGLAVRRGDAARVHDRLNSSALFPGLQLQVPVHSHAVADHRRVSPLPRADAEIEPLHLRGHVQRRAGAFRLERHRQRDGFADAAQREY